MFVTVNVSFNAYACHEVHFVAKFMKSQTYVPKSSRHEVTFHRFTLSSLFIVRKYFTYKADGRVAEMAKKVLEEDVATWREMHVFLRWPKVQTIQFRRILSHFRVFGQKIWAIIWAKI